MNKSVGYALFHIDDLTAELKDVLREQLSFICHGISNASSKKDLYSYKRTLTEFLLRYESKTENIKIGMIGELLAHVLISEYFGDKYHIASPYFNLEERSIKKGFDVVLASKFDYSIFITEVKAGELHKNKDASSTTVDLLNTAKLDLRKRLNKENHSLWLNAINGAKIAFDNNNNIKNAIVDILEKYDGISPSDSDAGSEINVCLISALFAPLTDRIVFSKVGDKYKAINDESLFKSIFVLSLQKGTYQKIHEFLKKECV